MKKQELLLIFGILLLSMPSAQAQRTSLIDNSVSKLKQYASHVSENISKIIRCARGEESCGKKEITKTRIRLTALGLLLTMVILFTFAKAKNEPLTEEQKNVQQITSLADRLYKFLTYDAPINEVIATLNEYSTFIDQIRGNQRVNEILLKLKIQNLPMNDIINQLKEKYNVDAEFGIFYLKTRE